MSFAGGKRIMYSSMIMAVTLIMLVLQIWVCCDCQAEAIRIFPGTGMTKVMKESNITTSSYKKSFKGDLLYHKYFNGRAFNFNRTDQKGFEANKRRVPSCPDPLHN